MKVVALHPVQHDGKRYEPGSTIPLTDKEAAPLIAAGIVEEAAARKPDAKAKEEADAKAKAKADAEAQAKADAEAQAKATGAEGGTDASQGASS